MLLAPLIFPVDMKSSVMTNASLGSSKSNNFMCFSAMLMALSIYILEALSGLLFSNF
jgi:hypothetical protein